jgi:predicted outer membrane repeat protein
VLEARWVPSQVNLTVTSLADTAPRTPPVPGTLRAAILTADAGSPSDKFTIGFSVSGTIALQSPLPDLNNSIAIQGPGASSLTIEPAGASFSAAMVTADAGQTASLSGLTMASAKDGGIINNGTLTVANCAVVNNTAPPLPFLGFSTGGGILNNQGSTLTVSNSTLSGNSATDGGAIYSFGTLTISGCTLSGNSATFGGAIVEQDGTAAVSASTFAGNSATYGGGIYNDSMVTVSGCTLSGNSASYAGGGIYSTGQSTVVSTSTISGNSATFGGGFFNVLALTIANSTLTGNSATYGGGIYNEGSVPGVTVRDSVLSANSATEGGGIYNAVFGTLEAQGSTFSGNTASDSGGGIYNLGTATVQQSTLSANTAGSNGGGVFNGASGTLAVRDSTVLGNSAPSGADIYNLGALTLDDSTVGVTGP